MSKRILTAALTALSLGAASVAGAQQLGVDPMQQQNNTQLQQPLNGTYQLQQPLNGTGQLQQPLNGTYQLQQPLNGTAQMQQPLNGTGQLQQPLNGTYQLQQPLNGTEPLQQQQLLDQRAMLNGGASIQLQAPTMNNNLQSLPTQQPITPQPAQPIP